MTNAEEYIYEIVGRDKVLARFTSKSVAERFAEDFRWWDGIQMCPPPDGFFDGVTVREIPVYLSAESFLRDLPEGRVVSEMISSVRLNRARESARAKLTREGFTNEELEALGLTNG